MKHGEEACGIYLDIESRRQRQKKRGLNDRVILIPKSNRLVPGAKQRRGSSSTNLGEELKTNVTLSRFDFGRRRDQIALFLANLNDLNLDSS